MSEREHPVRDIPEDPWLDPYPAVMKLRRDGRYLLWFGGILVGLSVVPGFVRAMQDQDYGVSFGVVVLLTVGLMLATCGIVAKLLATHSEAAHYS